MGNALASPWRAALGIAIVAGALLAIGLDRPGFFDNEGRYAAVAREMLVRGDFVTPELNGSLFLNKPPLLYWLAAGAFRLGAADEQVRIVSALAAAVTVLCTILLGGQLFGARTGVTAGLLLATTFGFVLEGRTLRPDGVMVACVVGALLCWQLAERRGRRWWLVPGYAALALGFLAKGAVPVLLVTMPVVACTLRDHGWSGLRRLRPWLGLAVFVAIAAPWHLLVAWRHAGFAWDYVVNQHLLFMFDRKLPRDSEGDPLRAFWLAAIGRSLPWVVLVPLTAREAWRGARRSAPAAARSSALCWVWAAGVVLTFSAVPSRLEHYSLPALPAVALLAARGYEHVRAGPARAAWTWLALVAVGCIAAGLLGLLPGPLLLERWELFRLLPGLRTTIRLAALTALAGGGVLLAAALRRRAAGVALGLAVLAVPMDLVLTRAMAEVEPVFSWRPLARAIAARLPPSVEIVFEAPQEYQQVGGLAYYTRRRITLLEPEGGFTPPTYLAPQLATLFLPRAEFPRRWTGPEPLAFVSDPKRRRDSPDGLVPEPFTVLGRSGHRWLLVNGRPSGAPAPSLSEPRPDAAPRRSAPGRG